MNPSDPTLEDFRAIERSDPWWSLAHLSLAMTWIGLLGITNAGEGIAFGLLTAVAAIRLPSTLRLYSMLLQSTAMRCFLAFAAWQAVSVAWSTNPAVRWHDGIIRFTVVPFALWPLAHRARELAFTFCAAAALHSISIIGLNVRLQRVILHTRAAAGKEVGMTAACLVPALLVLLLAARPRNRIAAATRWLGAMAIAGALAILSQRTAFVTLAASLCAAVARLLASPGRSRRVAVSVAIGIALGVSALSLSPRVRHTAVDVWKSSARPDAGASDINRITSGRYSLALVALDMFHAHPILGCGARSFETEIADRMRGDTARFEVPKHLASAYGSLATSHNAFLDEASMRGVVGIVLLALLIQSMVIAAWNSPADAVTLPAVVAWVAVGLSDATTSRGTYLALLGILVARCAMLDGPPQHPTRNGAAEG
jgi:hypothetical protein